MPILADKRKNNIRIMMGIECLQEISDYSNITQRESEILQLIAAGNKNTEIAYKLKLSVRTVETYRFNLIAKLKLESASQLVICAVDYVQMRKNKTNIIAPSLRRESKR
jgi:DNA-binding NarL/FixJ family response regulator